jgi:hypothetical protein
LLRALIAARTGDRAASDELGWARNIAVRLAATGSTETRASAPRR